MFGKLGEMKKLYDKYRTLQKALKNLIIRAKEGKFNNSNGEESDSIIADISGEMKLIELNINDISLLDPSNKKHLEDMIVKCIQKAQDKAQQVVAEKTKEILGFDPSDMANMMGGGGMPGMPGLN
ncbi:MAG: YbaB/EbfC family nucleoid-associated protein [Candidatus Absconditicoccaceae bacterium]